MGETRAKSLRKQDEAAEKQLADFMDAYFYKKLGKKFIRVTDSELQKKGVDVILGEEEKNIDEKASIYYSNMMIPTFVFELEFMKDDNRIIGWYLNDSLITDYYMLIWPNVKDIKEKETDGSDIWIRKDIAKITKNDFTIVEAMLISKEKLKKELEKRKLTEMRLSQYIEVIRKAPDKKIYTEGYRLDDGIKIMLSDKLNERPINLVINRKLLYGIADRVYLISQDGYASIKH